MKTSILKKLALTAALCAGAFGFNTGQAAIGSFTGSYTNNFDSLGTNGTTLPVGFTSMVIAGANSTYTAANPISATAIAAATADTQTLTIWNAGSAVASSGTTTFNIGCWDSLTDRALGTDPTGTGANVIQLAMTNNTGGTLAGVTFWYDCKCLTNGTSGDGTEKAELPGYCFFYSTAGATNAAASWIEVGVAGNVIGSTNSAGLPIKNGLTLPNYTQGTTMSSGPVTITFATPLTNNGIMYFRWVDDNCQTVSPDQALAIDNVGITAIPAAGPYASITSPANNANSIPGSNLVITASAGDYTSTITNVEFFAGSTDLGGVTTAPYTLTNSSLALGSYALTAVASDIAGLSITSAVVNITVAYVPPTVSITAPANAANFTPGSSVSITAAASDLDTTVTNVEFFAGSTDLGGVTTAPYSVTWPTVPAGSYALTAVAKDALGLASTSAVVNVTLSYLPPVVSLTSPTTGSKFSAPATIALVATATDSTATVTNVAFYYQGTNLLGNATSAPYAFSWSNVVASTYSLTARATDNQGLSTTSAVVSVTVTNLPIISFTGSYAQNFDSDLSNGSTFIPAGFTCLLLPGTTNTYSQTNPISSAAMVSATNSSAQTLLVWNAGSARVASATSLFNAGTQGNNIDRCLGSAPTNTAGDVIQLAMTNNTGGSLAGLVFSYDCKCLTNGTVGTEQSELPGYCFFYSTTGTTPANSWIEVGAAGNVPGATNSAGVPIANGLCLPNFTQGTTMSSGPVTITFPQPLTNGGVMYFRWADDKNQANKQDQMLGIDNISITGISAAGPLASITSPGNNANFIPGSNVGITVNASETGGSITNVEFYANGTDLGGTTNAPYGLTWTNPAAGSYGLTVIASDTFGVTATSSVVNVTVSYVLPTVSLTSPTNGTNYVPGTGTPIVLTANATDNSGTNITSVAFYANSSLISSVSSAPYTFTIPASYVGTTVPVGSYALTAVVTDALGLISTSAVVNITIAYVPPTVSLTSPASGTAFISPATVTLAATAAATGGTVTNVAFYNGSTLLANVTSAPYTYNWANVAAGSYTLTAQASDSNGGTATSTAVSISVTNPLVASFTGVYTQNFDLALSNNSTIMPAGYTAMYLAGSHFTYTNAPGLLLDSNAIATATIGSGASTLVVWPFGSAVNKASYQLFNVVGGFTNSTDCALGTDPTGTAGTVIQLALTNNTGGALNGVIFSYTEKCMTNGSTSNGSYTDDGTERLELPGYEFFYSTVGDTNGFNWTQSALLSATNWVQGTASNAGPVTLLFPTPLTNGGVMYFRWADDNCVPSSPDQMYAIDNISIRTLGNSFLAVADAGAGFNGGENVIFTNVSGSSYYAWSSPDPSISVTNWTLEGQLSELPLGTTGNSRYGINLNPVTSPVYYIIAKTNVGPFTATEALNWLTTADYSTFTVNGANVTISGGGIFDIPGVNTFPTVNLTAPANVSAFTPGNNIIISANAIEIGGNITNVEFYANATDLGSVTNAPYSLTWSNVVLGSYALTAVASDAVGISTTSAVVNIIVHVPPTVSLTAPANGAKFLAPASVTLSATASDTDGTVTNVAFYQGSTLQTNIASAPYTYTWSNATAGAYALTAVATDDSGSSGTSGVVNINVTNAPVPVSPALAQIKTFFIIPLENHDFVQQNPTGSPQQLFGNPACPYFNSLITPGNSNAVQTAYATHYYSVAINGEHPSEPNYIWSEAGTDFGVRTDNDPSVGSGNLYSGVQHLSGQLLAAGIPWKNYQEDVEYSSGPTVSASGSSSVVNPYNGTTQYSYAVKHNPMAFFTDTWKTNVYPLTNFWADLANNNVGRYNWVTPNQYNEMHSSLPSGYTYHGVAYTGDQAAIAEGDNALSIIIPKIMASQAYQDHGVIIIWTDETESTDDTNTTLPFVIISPLAKGNAYASTLPYSHSSDLKTMDEIFGLAFQTNAIPAANLDAQNTGYNYVDGRSAVINDLSDFFQTPTPPVITVPATITVEATNATGNVVKFTVTATNSTGGVLTPSVTPVSGSVFPLGTNIVTATATDANSLSATSTFAVIVRDTTPPVITVLGANPLTNFQSVAFTDPGATARDIVSGSVPVTTNSNVNVNTLGTYAVRYTASDATGNTATNTRTVQVVAIPVPANLNGAAVSGGGNSGAFQLSFTGAVGQPYRVLGTSDLSQPLANWTVLASGLVTNNPVIFTDLGAVTNLAGYYRIVSP